MVLRIKLLRVARGMSQEELAKMIGVTQGAVSQWEKGLTHPGFKVIPKLANALGVTSDELFGIKRTGGP